MTASRWRPTARFQPGMAAIYACTGASPSAFEILGLPPARRAGFATRADFLDALPAIVFTLEGLNFPRCIARNRGIAV